ncbi:MAG: hypothetical protein GY927_24595 [bacterium]|nr:hypothetical protein [bacterium]
MPLPSQFMVGFCSSNPSLTEGSALELLSIRYTIPSHKKGEEMSNESISMTRNSVFLAVKDEVQMWRANQISAINGFNGTNMPLLQEKPVIFQAAAWFGLGMTAAKKLTPAGAIGTMATRAAGPLFVLDAATKYFAAAHSQLMKEGRLQLEERFGQYKGKLVDGVNNAERSFYTNPSYGKPLIYYLSELTVNDRFASDELASEFLRKILHESGAVVTETNPIKQQTRVGLTKVAKVIENVYRVSKYGPGVGGNKILKRTQGSGPFAQDDFKMSNCRLPKHL